MNLRPYQNEAVESIFREWIDHTSTLIVVPTGGGKTQIFTEVIRRTAPKKSIVVAHREELISQARNRIESMTGLKCEVEMGESEASDSLWHRADVIIATVQTLNSGIGVKRMEKFRPDDFGLLVCDEGHHCTASTWERVIKHFTQNKELKVLGVSVGPRSFVELRGGCYGAGFVGEIEAAFELAAKSRMPREWFGFHVIDLDGVYSRGWTGCGFAWKPCLRILRHSGKPCLSIGFHGGALVVTPDHSIYEAVAARKVRLREKNSWNYKHTAGIRCGDADKITPEKILVGDDGLNFNCGAGVEIDMLSFCRAVMADSVSVVCDVKLYPRQLLRGIANPKTIFQWRAHGAIPLKFYLQLHYPPEAKALRVEGSSCTIAPKINLADWAYILGFFLGDGWISSDPKSRRLGFAVEVSQEHEITARLRTLAGVGWKVTSRKMPGASVELRASNIFVANLLLSIFGDVRCHNKFVPGDWIVSWSEGQRAELLQGLLDSAGAVCTGPQNTRRNVIVTTSGFMARGILSLLRSLGRWGSIHERQPSKGGTVNGRQINGRRIAYLVHWSGSEKLGHAGKRSKFHHDPLCFTEAHVRKVEEADSPAWVYDLEMSGHPSFVADGVLVHNTATPDRADEIALGKIFETVAFEYDLPTAIHDGWLVDVRQKFATIQGLDYSQCRTTAGELNQGDLAKIMEEEETVQGVAAATIEFSGEKRTIVFAVSVAQAEALSNIFNRHRPGCAGWICGKTPKDERRELLAKFDKGGLQFMVNVGCLSEGYDSPGVEVISMARRTLSRSLYSQMLGRATRPLPGIVDPFDLAEDRRLVINSSSKAVCWVLDFVGNSGRHKLVSSADILGGKYDEEVVERATRKAQTVQKPMSEILAACDAEVRNEQAEREERRRSGIVAKARFTLTDVSPFDLFQIRPEQERGWDSGRTLTPKQQAVLVKSGIDTKGMTYTQQKQLLNEQFKRWNQKLCTYKQAKLLAKHGYDTSTMSMETATYLITELKENGWKRIE